MSAPNKRRISLTIAVAVVAALLALLLGIEAQPSIQAQASESAIEVAGILDRLQAHPPGKDLGPEELLLLSDLAALHTNALTDFERSTLLPEYPSQASDTPLDCWIRAVFLHGLQLPELALGELDRALDIGPPEALLPPILEGRVTLSLRMATPDPALTVALLEEAWTLGRSGQSAVRALQRVATLGPGKGMHYCAPGKCRTLGLRHYHPEFLEEVLGFASGEFRAWVENDPIVRVMRKVRELPPLCGAPHDADDAFVDILSELNTLCASATDTATQENALRLYHDLSVASHNPSRPPLETLEDVAALYARLSAQGAPPLALALVKETESSLLLQQGRLDPAAESRAEAARLLRSSEPRLSIDGGLLETQAIEDEAYAFLCYWYGRSFDAAITELESFVYAHPNGPMSAQARGTADSIHRSIGRMRAAEVPGRDALMRDSKALAETRVDVPWLGDGRDEAMSSPIPGPPLALCPDSSAQLESLAAALLDGVPTPPPSPEAADSGQTKPLDDAVIRAAYAEDGVAVMTALFDRMNLKAPDPALGDLTLGFLTALSSLPPTDKRVLATREWPEPRHFKALCAHASIIIGVADPAEGAGSPLGAEGALRRAGQAFRDYIDGGFRLGDASPDYATAALALRNCLFVADALGEQARAYEQVVADLRLDAQAPAWPLTAESADFLYRHYFSRVRQALAAGDLNKAHQHLLNAQAVANRVLNDPPDLRAQNDAQSALDFALGLAAVLQWMEG